ncbi:glycoside hydrolase family 108 protein [Sulfitobacter pacificus]|uniref:glycoside hydrolase family 108 protein n=1 Tax=Sulfitobacter pacificus TaxID=1499314 RepID=UPI003106883A
MRDNFEESLKAVLVHEGGYVNHPKDPGGATNKGITHRTYAAWQHKHGLPTDNVRNITDEQVAAIYKKQYWDTIRGDDLPHGIDYAVFDFAVNSGPARAAKFLQRIVGVSADGIIGLQTLRAAESTGSDKRVVIMLCQNRLAWLKRLKTWSTFGRGWQRRVEEVQAKSIRLAERDYTLSTGPEATKAAQGKADGPITTKEAVKEAMRDPKAIGGAVAVAMPSAATILQGNGPVQWAIGAVMVIAALSVAFFLWQRGRADT